MAHLKKTVQTTLFGEADIPFELVSTRLYFTPEAGEDELPVRQESMAACRVCADTGVVAVDGEPRFCTCKAGSIASRTAGLLVGTSEQEGKNGRSQVEDDNKTNE